MWSRSLSAAVVIHCLTWSGPAAAQTKPAFIYSLPADGAYVEYELVGKGVPINLTGTVRISSVGVKMVNNAPHRWIELRSETKEGEKARLEIVKLLVAEKALTGGQALDQAVAEGYEKKGADGALMKMSAERIKRFVYMDVAGKDADMKLVKDAEDVETKLGKFKAKHMTLTGSPGGAGDGSVEFHVWLTNDVPFGWAKFEIKAKFGESDGFTMMVESAKKGDGAKSELDETKVK